MDFAMAGSVINHRKRHGISGQSDEDSISITVEPPVMRRYTGLFHFMKTLVELVRRNWLFFLLATIAGLALRLFFVFRFPHVAGDSLIYGDIAKNWLQHGIYGLSGPDEISPTYIRLPGYPAFLAAVFAIFGMEHYRAVLALQVVVDVGTCFLIADMARRLVSPRAARAAFLLAALCPFLASYAAAALTETLEIFFTVLAFDCAIAGLEAQQILRVQIIAYLGDHTLQTGEFGKRDFLAAGIFRQSITSILRC
jgi:hypothetical protein